MESPLGRKLVILAYVAGMAGGCANGVENGLHNVLQEPSVGVAPGRIFGNLVDACTSLDVSDCPVYSGTNQGDNDCVSQVGLTRDQYIQDIVDSAIAYTGDDSVTFDDIRNGDVPSNALIRHGISNGTDGGFESMRYSGGIYVTFDIEDEIIGSDGFWCEFEEVQYIGDDYSIPSFVATGYYYDYLGYPERENPDDRIGLANTGGVNYSVTDPTTVGVSPGGTYSQSRGYDTGNTVDAVNLVTSRISDIVDTFLPREDIPSIGEEVEVQF
ncbi:MAG: hypothetical protein WCT46_06565 [Candidatus Gracilibacteria bacterium]